MKYSLSGLHLTEQFESCKLTAYPDIHGVWTIGWGHTGPDVKPGLAITQAQAEELLMNDINWAANIVNTLVKVDLSQREFDALTDFVFNVGSGSFHGSTLLTLLNKGDYKNAALEFDKWDKCGGQVCAGLLRRRGAETVEFNTSYPQKS